MAKAFKTHGKLGSGARFAQMSGHFAAQPGVRNPGALAAYVGRQAHGAKKMASLARTGAKKAAKK